MEESRRRVLWLGLGLFVTGCSSQLSSNLDRPDVEWPDSPSHPRTAKAISSTSKTPIQTTVRTTKPQANAPAIKQQMATTPATPPKNQPTAPATGLARIFPPSDGLIVEPRSRWADQGPMMERINPMGDVDKITVHHEGWNPVVFTDVETTAERLELIRRSHIQRLGAGDIGYHFVVDRAGRVWEAREAKYQGAHVRGHNENNIGVMCLGNFDIQSPSNEQLRSLVTVIKALQRHYKVALKDIKTHQEINPTHCPGTVLQAYMVQIRRNKTLV